MIGLGNVMRVVSAFALLGLMSAHTNHASAAKPIAIKVYKTPQCGCCKGWVKHLQANGFQVETFDMPDLSSVKQKYGVAPALQACHTAVVNGYVVEGHVPADVIMKFLKERSARSPISSSLEPAVAGVAVPGMPSGSPGMEGALKQKYDVYTFDRAGHTKVFAHK
ncbi:MAG TPA: DUF411 domain-containing protein [Gemmatimonadaceae bacterium]|jgi:hypothetical protein|nr:DUF411 domain-containing protein [Gemmatimonadaceae bacterium]